MDGWWGSGSQGCKVKTPLRFAETLASFAPLHSVQRMNFQAFVTLPTLRFTGFLRRNNTLVSNKRRKPQICRHRGRIPITNGNLYPEVDPPEPIPNPLKENKESSKPDDSEEPFLKRLNDRTAQRRVTDTVAKPLEPTTSEEDSGSAEVGGVVDYSSATLSSEPNEQRVSNFTAAARALWRLGWFGWWVQLILSVISGVILLFSFAFPGISVRSSASMVGFVLSGAGVLIAFISLFWTYSYTRLSLWLERGKGTAEQARLRINSRLRFGVLFSIAGLFVSLIGLQAIVGTLLARLFGAGIATTPYTAYQTATPSATSGLVPGAGVVQPVDVLIVQACANAMMALLTALIVTSWLRSREKVWNKKAEVQ